jgi:SAM-dependent methyltransferase
MRRVGTIRLASAIAADLARSTARLAARRVRRHGEVVASEYDRGHWKNMLDSRRWASAAGLEDFLVGADARERLVKLDGEVVQIATREYYRRRIALFQSLIRQEAGETDEMLELGCGYGYNLFSLSLDARWKRLSGVDISRNALEAGGAIARHFGLESRIAFHPLDITDPAHPGFRHIENRTVFTFFCIEQVPYAVEKVIENLLAHRPRRVIHVEPTTERLALWRPLDLLNYVYVKSVDYQTRLFTVVEALARRGRVRVLTDGRCGFAPTIHNEGFVLTWEPK